MPKIGDVEYDEAGFEHMRGLYALAQPELDGEPDKAILREAAFVHEMYRQFPGTTMSSPEDAAPPAARRKLAATKDLVDPF